MPVVGGDEMMTAGFIVVDKMVTAGLVVGDKMVTLVLW